MPSSADSSSWIHAAEPAKARAGDEGGDEAVPGHQQRRPVGQQRDHQDAKGPARGGAQSGAAGTTPGAHHRLPRPATPATTPTTSSTRAATSDSRGPSPSSPASTAIANRTTGVARPSFEPALHVERPSDAGRDDRVQDRGGAQAGVGRGQGSGQEQRHHDGQVGEQHAGEQVAEQDRQGEPDEQQPGDRTPPSEPISRGRTWAASWKRIRTRVISATSLIRLGGRPVHRADREPEYRARSRRTPAGAVTRRRPRAADDRREPEHEDREQDRRRPDAVEQVCRHALTVASAGSADRAPTSAGSGSSWRAGRPRARRPC